MCTFKLNFPLLLPLFYCINRRLPDNEIDHVDNSLFQNLSQLLLVTLRNNRLTKLDEDTFDGAYKLRRIFLSQNQLESIPFALFSNLTKLESMYVYTCWAPVRMTSHCQDDLNSPFFPLQTTTHTHTIC